MARTKYYSFLCSSTENNLPSNAEYYGLGIGKHAMRFHFIIDTRAQAPPIWGGGMMGTGTGLLGGIGLGSFQDRDKTYAIEVLVTDNAQTPKVQPIHTDTSSLNVTNTALQGNEQLFEITFDVSIIRKN